MLPVRDYPLAALGDVVLDADQERAVGDRRELQRNVKGFVTLSKYLLRGSEHDKTATPSKPQGATV